MILARALRHLRHPLAPPRRPLVSDTRARAHPPAFLLDVTPPSPPPPSQLVCPVSRHWQLHARGTPPLGGGHLPIRPTGRPAILPGCRHQRTAPGGRAPDPPPRAAGRAAAGRASRACSRVPSRAAVGGGGWPPGARRGYAGGGGRCCRGHHRAPSQRPQIGQLHTHRHFPAAGAVPRLHQTASRPSPRRGDSSRCI